jgi:hypothetical protein
MALFRGDHIDHRAALRRIGRARAACRVWAFLGIYILYARASSFYNSFSILLFLISFLARAK